jgi:hypothetical protein
MQDILGYVTKVGAEWNGSKIQFEAMWREVGWGKQRGSSWAAKHNFDGSI